MCFEFFLKSLFFSDKISFDILSCENPTNDCCCSWFSPFHNTHTTMILCIIIYMTEAVIPLDRRVPFRELRTKKGGVQSRPYSYDVWVENMLYMLWKRESTCCETPWFEYHTKYTWRCDFTNRFWTSTMSTYDALVDGLATASSIEGRCSRTHLCGVLTYIIKGVKP